MSGANEKTLETRWTSSQNCIDLHVELFYAYGEFILLISSYLSWSHSIWIECAVIGRRHGKLGRSHAIKYDLLKVNKPQPVSQHNKSKHNTFKTRLVDMVTVSLQKEKQHKISGVNMWKAVLRNRVVCIA